MNCQRCGAGVPENAAICPSCGTITSTVWPAPQQSTDYGRYAHSSYDGPPQQASYGQGYGPQPGYMPPPQPNFGYAPQSNAPPQYHPGPVNVTVINNPTASTKNNGALIAEILLSLLLGIYGIGWLMAGETTVGVILLLCSFFIYWPTIILGTIFTLGIGLLCLIPLAIGAVILNAVLLNSALNRKASQFMMVQANVMPPRYHQ